MAFFDGAGSNGLAVVVDVRSKFCHETSSVLRDWALGRRALGRGQWYATLKVALREYGTEPWNAKRVKEEKDAIVEQLSRRGIRCVVPVQTPNIPGVRQVHSAWNMLGHSGNPYKWAGTVERVAKFHVCPILHPANYEFVYGWLLERWLKQAHAVASGYIAPMAWPYLHHTPDNDMLAVLAAMRRCGGPLAVDIETSMDGKTITAIGFADRAGAVSVPWHGFTIAGSNGEHEPALSSYPRGQAIQAEVLQILESASIPKILHNGAFDVVQLGRHGITLRGFAHDTLLMHRVVYPQFRHGLQQSCATEFCVEPWKCLFKPPSVDKDADPWLGCPVKLRQYNCKDSYATYQLWRHLEGKLG